MKTAETKAKDANVEKCVALMRSRADVGLKKYGVTTERTDLTPLEWVRHWQAENADATIYAEKLVQEIENLTESHRCLVVLCAKQLEELEVLRKAIANARELIRDAARDSKAGFMVSGPLGAVAEILGLDLFSDLATKKATAKRPPSALRPPPSVLSAPPSAPSAPSAPSDPPDSNEWHDAQKTPPDVGHAVIGMVNGTTKTRAVYYVAKTGKWVDVNDRPVTVSQWRHL